MSATFLGHEKKVHSVHWSASGEHLASGSVDYTARVWDVSKHAPGRETVLRGHTDSVEQVKWHPSDKNVLLSASIDKSVRLWDRRKKQSGGTVRTAGENINVAWNNAGTEVAVGNRSDLISFIDVRTLAVVRTRQFSVQANEFAWTDGDRFFLTSTGSGHVDISSYPELETAHKLHGHTASVYSLAMTKKYVACGATDALISLWSLDDLVCVKTIVSLQKPVRTLDFSHCGNYLAAASEDPFIQITHLRSILSKVLVAEQQKIPVKAPINSLAWNPKVPALAYAADEANGAIHIYVHSTKQNKK